MSMRPVLRYNWQADEHVAARSHYRLMYLLTLFNVGFRDVQLSQGRDGIFFVGYLKND